MKKAKKGYKELFVIATGDYLKKKIRQYLEKTEKSFGEYKKD